MVDSSVKKIEVGGIRGALKQMQAVLSCEGFSTIRKCDKKRPWASTIEI